MKDNKNKYLVPICIVLLIIITVAAGTVGLYNHRLEQNKKQNVIEDNTAEENDNNEANQEDLIEPTEEVIDVDEPNQSETMTADEAYQIYLTNLSNDMKKYIDEGGYFYGIGKSYDGYTANYKITNDLKLYLTGDYADENKYGAKHENELIDNDVLAAYILTCSQMGHLCLYYYKSNGSFNTMRYVNEYLENQTNDIYTQNGNPTTMLLIQEGGRGISDGNFGSYLMSDDNNEIVDKDINKQFIRSISNLKNIYNERYAALKKFKDENPDVLSADSSDLNDDIFRMKEINFDTLTLKQDDKDIVDTDVLLFKVLYDKNNNPTLYYLKTDGYWYSYDYYNKTNPVTKKINLENIVDVKKFIYNNGDEKVLFVDIRGNLHEI